MAELFSFLGAVVLFIAIMDPFLGVIALMAISKDESQQGKKENANKAVLVATIVAMLFVIFGRDILSIFSISIEGFQVAGGIILLLMGIQTMLGIDIHSKNLENKEAGAIIIGTPLIAGPGTITTIIITTAKIGHIMTFFAVAASLGFTWLILRTGVIFGNKIPSIFIRIFSGLMGLLLTSIAVEFIASGLRTYVGT